MVGYYRNAYLLSFTLYLNARLWLERVRTSVTSHFTRILGIPGRHYHRCDVTARESRVNHWTCTLDEVSRKRIHSSTSGRRGGTDENGSATSHFWRRHFRYVAAIGHRSTSGKFLERRWAERVNKRVDDDTCQRTATSRRSRSELSVSAAGTSQPVVAVAARVPSRKFVVHRVCDVACQTAYWVSNVTHFRSPANFTYHTNDILSTCARQLDVILFSSQLRRRLYNYFTMRQLLSDNITVVFVAILWIRTRPSCL